MPSRPPPPPRPSWPPPARREQETQAEIDGLHATLADVAVEAYINAGTLDDAAAVLRTDDIESAVQRRELVHLRAGQYQEVLDRLRSLSEDLAIARGQAQQASAAAAQFQGEVADRLHEVEAAPRPAGRCRRPGRRPHRARARRGREPRGARRPAGRPDRRRAGGHRRPQPAQRQRSRRHRQQPDRHHRPDDGPRHHRGLGDRRPARVDAGRGRGRRHRAQRRRLPVLRLADRTATGPLRRQRLRHLRGAAVVVQPADGPARSVDARAGPGHRLHLPGPGHQLAQQPRASSGWRATPAATASPTCRPNPGTGRRTASSRRRLPRPRRSGRGARVPAQAAPEHRPADRDEGDGHGHRGERPAQVEARRDRLRGHGDGEGERDEERQRRPAASRDRCRPGTGRRGRRR